MRATSAELPRDGSPPAESLCAGQATLYLEAEHRDPPARPRIVRKPLVPTKQSNSISSVCLPLIQSGSATTSDRLQVPGREAVTQREPYGDTTITRSTRVSRASSPRYIVPSP